MAATRRATKQGLGAVRRQTRTSIVPGPIICPPPTPHASDTPPRMRSGPVEKAVEPSEPPPSGRTAKRRRFSQRPPSVRVDDVGATAASMSADLAIPRPTLSARRPAAKLETHEAWVLSLVDGTMTIDDIADVTGIQRVEVAAIVTRLADVGYIAKGRFR